MGHRVYISLASESAEGGGSLALLWNETASTKAEGRWANDLTDVLRPLQQNQTH